jgi:hypothetical protein
MKTSLCALAATLAMGSLAAAQSAPPSSTTAATAPKAVAPRWAQRPDGSAVARYFPEAARRAGASGRAKVRCIAAADGSLRECAVTAETPVGFGFGESSKRLVQETFRLHPTLTNGAPVTGAAITVPVAWSLPR